ncbi:MAG: DsbA family protein [Acidimicrobiales bacterium]|nr:DsbA family protein [Acidimicrobiales bacterium]
MTTGSSADATVAGEPGALTPVDVHIDLMCPWAYQAALWLRAVRAANGVDLRWRWFSLEEVNHTEGKKHPWERPWAWGWSLLRIGAWLQRSSTDAADAWCAAAGRALHVDGRKVHTPDVARAVLDEAGLDPGAVDAAIDDPTTHDEVMADHRRVTALGGFGVPTLVFPGERAIFGPIIREAPPEADALRLWDLVTGWLEFPALYEVRRPKTAADWAQIGDRFAPYLSARDWPTIQREVL